MLRWFGPFFLLLILLTSGLLALQKFGLYSWLFVVLALCIFVLPWLDLALKKLKVNILPLRAVRYFILMNIALLEGFFKFLKGVKSSVWEPPKRG